MEGTGAFHCAKFHDIPWNNKSPEIKTQNRNLSKFNTGAAATGKNLCIPLVVKIITLSDICNCVFNEMIDPSPTALNFRPKAIFSIEKFSCCYNMSSVVCRRLTRVYCKPTV